MTGVICLGKLGAACYDVGVEFDLRGRAIIDHALGELIGELVSANPKSLGHIDPRAVLLVSGAARRQASASIRPLSYGARPLSPDGLYRKPEVIIDGYAALYEITLRPRFFLELTPEERRRTFAHELWHIAPEFDGTLAEERRHRALRPADVEGINAELVARWRAAFPDSPAGAVFDWNGELRMRAWVSRPPTRIRVDAKLERVRYDESDLFHATIWQRGETGSMTSSPRR